MSVTLFKVPAWRRLHRKRLRGDAPHSDYGMKTMVPGLLKRLGRTVLLLLLASLGTIMLMRLAPGYYADAREMDAQYAQHARAELAIERGKNHSVFSAAVTSLTFWLHGNLGLSRQYGVPVAELIRPRLRVTASLLLRGVSAGWLLALAFALPLSARRGRSGEVLITVSAACLLAVPIGAMATLCLLTDAGGPALALTVLIGTRSFKFLYRLLREAWRAPHLLQARAQGTSTLRIARTHLLPVLQPQLLALATMSLVIGLGAAVPAEVVFNVAGIGQLAWSAAMNRDLPVLLATTLLMATVVGCAGLLAEPAARTETV